MDLHHFQVVLTLCFATDTKFCNLRKARG